MITQDTDVVDLVVVGSLDLTADDARVVRSALRAALKRAQRSYNPDYVPPEGHRDGNRVIMDCCQDLIERLQKMMPDGVSGEAVVTRKVKAGTGQQINPD